MDPTRIVTYRCLILFILGPLAAISTSIPVLGQAELGGHQIVSGACKVQKPRFSSRYANYKGLRDAARDEREHLANIAVKDAQASMFVQASMRELDLTGNDTCDDIVVVSDPVSSGGDRDVLATVYVANNGLWHRVGAASATRTDGPSELDTRRSPADATFAFDEYVALRRPGWTKTYLIAWHSERVTNGFAGYRVLEIDLAASTLRLIDKWTGEGSKVYAAFKQTKDTPSAESFDSAIEAQELRELCGSTNNANHSLAAECNRLKR